MLIVSAIICFCIGLGTDAPLSFILYGAACWFMYRGTEV